MGSRCRPDTAPRADRLRSWRPSTRGAAPSLSGLLHNARRHEGERLMTHPTTRFIALCSLLALFVGAAHAQKPYTTWRAYGGSASSSQYSALDQINKKNVTQLEVAWTFPVGERGFTQNPIVVDRTMYVAAR